MKQVPVASGQVAEFQLPTRPTERNDSRGKGFDGKSLEVDASVPKLPRGTVERRSVCHGAPETHRRLRAIGAAGRETLAWLAVGHQEVSMEIVSVGLRRLAPWYRLA